MVCVRLGLLFFATAECFSSRCCRNTQVAARMFGFLLLLLLFAMADCFSSRCCLSNQEMSELVIFVCHSKVPQFSSNQDAEFSGNSARYLSLCLSVCIRDICCTKFCCRRATLPHHSTWIQFSSRLASLPGHLELTSYAWECSSLCRAVCCKQCACFGRVCTMVI